MVETLNNHASVIVDWLQQQQLALHCSCLFVDDDIFTGPNIVVSGAHEFVASRLSANTTLTRTQARLTRFSRTSFDRCFETTGNDAHSGRITSHLCYCCCCSVLFSCLSSADHSMPCVKQTLTENWFSHVCISPKYECYFKQKSA